MKILLVDDDDFVRGVVEKQLQSGGYDVDTAVSPIGALEKLDAAGDEYDLLISDIVMPNQDGGQFMKTVREKGYRFPILAITGGNENAVADMVNYADLYADAVLVKPIGKDDLLRKVGQLLSGDLRSAKRS